MKSGLDNFAPISLANVLFKVFEKIIYYRLNWWCGRLDVVQGMQFGFCRGRSADDSLAVLSSEIRLVFGRRMRLGALFLDIKGAFDNVNPILLGEILTQMDLHKKIIRFIDYATQAGNFLVILVGNFSWKG